MKGVKNEQDLAVDNKHLNPTVYFHTLSTFFEVFFHLLVLLVLFVLKSKLSSCCSGVSNPSFFSKCLPHRVITEWLCHASRLHNLIEKFVVLGNSLFYLYPGRRTTSLHLLTHDRAVSGQGGSCEECQG